MILPSASTLVVHFYLLKMKLLAKALEEYRTVNMKKGIVCRIVWKPGQLHQSETVFFIK